jgi:hypothetical protein
MYYRMKLPYFGLNVRLLFTDLFRIRIRIRVRIRIRIRIQNVYFGSGSGQKFRILQDPVPDPDPQHWKKVCIIFIKIKNLKNPKKPPKKHF